MKAVSPLPLRDLESKDRRFLFILQALALPASDQQGLFPEGYSAGDELVGEFWESFSSFLSGKGFVLESQHVAPLFDLDDAFDYMNDHTVSAWETEALHEDSLWQDIRQKAAKALLALGWPLGTPPSYQSDISNS